MPGTLALFFLIGIKLFILYDWKEKKLASMADALRHLCYVAVCALLRASSPQVPHSNITHLSMQPLSQEKNAHFVHKKRLPTVADKLA